MNESGPDAADDVFNDPPGGNSEVSAVTGANPAVLGIVHDLDVFVNDAAPCKYLMPALP